MSSIVLVDDEKDLLESLTRVLRKEFPNVRIQSTTRPVEAKGWLLRERPTLLITDVRMPEISGLELLSLVSERWGVIPTIIMTAFASPELDEALMLGTFHYLPKPFRNLELLRLVKRVLDEEQTKEEQTKDEPEGFAGTIAVSMLADIVQLHSLAGSSGALMVEAQRVKGKIFFVKGRIVHAEDGSFSGREAFNHILSWKSGRFSFLREIASKETIQVPTSELLIDALRLSDESQKEDDDLLFALEDDHEQHIDHLFQEMSASSEEERKPVVMDNLSPPTPPSSLPAPSEKTADIPPASSKPTTKLGSVSSSGSLEIVQVSSRPQRTDERNVIDAPASSGYLSSSAIPVNNLLESLRQLADLGGFFAASVCDGKKNLLLASYGEELDWQAALPLQQAALLQKLNLIQMIQGAGNIEDIVITSEEYFYILRLYDKNPKIFFTLVLHRKDANLALARIFLAETAKCFVFSSSTTQTSPTPDAERPSFER